MQEISDVRHELKKDIAGVDLGLSSLRTELKGEISGLRTELKGDISELRDEVIASRDESHQNQVAFITNIQDHERRITTLERR